MEENVFLKHVPALMVHFLEHMRMQAVWCAQRSGRQQKAYIVWTRKAPQKGGRAHPQQRRAIRENILTPIYHQNHARLFREDANVGISGGVKNAEMLRQKQLVMPQLLNSIHRKSQYLSFWRPNL